MRSASSGHQVKDENDQRHNQQNVDQAAGNVKAEAEQATGLKELQDRPKHLVPLYVAVRPGLEFVPGARAFVIN